MVGLARARKIYDRLAVGDIATFLANERSAAPHDLILAADVFIYFADLVPVVAASAGALAPGGLLAFKVETHGGDGIILGEKLRYAHGATYVRTVLENAGLDVVLLKDASARNEADAPVPGLVIVARRPAQG